MQLVGDNLLQVRNILLMCNVHGESPDSAKLSVVSFEQHHARDHFLLPHACFA